MARGGTRSGAGRKGMAGTVRTTIVMDAATLKLLLDHGGKSRGAYIRDAIAGLTRRCAEGVDVPATTIDGPTKNFALKAPADLMRDAASYVGGSAFSSLSEFIRTAVALRAKETT